MRLNHYSKFFLLFRILRHPSFRLFFIGQSISLIGTWIQLPAVSWLVWRMSHDPFLLGLAPFIGRLPTLFPAPLVDALVDRWDRHSGAVHASGVDPGPVHVHRLDDHQHAHRPATAAGLDQHRGCAQTVVAVNSKSTALNPRCFLPPPINRRSCSVFTGTGHRRDTASDIP
ncbi:MFS transporter [bacterium]|nr:MFS transporter [bacterium]